MTGLMLERYLSAGTVGRGLGEGLAVRGLKEKHHLYAGDARCGEGVRAGSERVNGGTPSICTGCKTRGGGGRRGDWK